MRHICWKTRQKIKEQDQGEGKIGRRIEKDESGFDWDAELSAEQRDALIDKMADQVDKRRMHLPAILFLDLHKPLAFLAGQSLLLSSGFLAPVFGPQNVQQYAKLFESRDNIERLIRRIEEMSLKETERSLNGTRQYRRPPIRAVVQHHHRHHDSDGTAALPLYSAHSGADGHR